MQDRTYWHVPGARSWHALSRWQPDGKYSDPIGVCGYGGREAWARGDPEISDRLPPSAHLCGNCARIIAARTDIEDSGDYGNVVAPV